MANEARHTSCCTLCEAAATTEAGLEPTPDLVARMDALRESQRNPVLADWLAGMARRDAELALVAVGGAL